MSAKKLPPPPDDFLAVLGEYMTARRAGGLAESTAKGIEKRLRDFARFLDMNGAAEFAATSQRHVEAYLAECRARYLERAYVASIEGYILMHASMLNPFFRWMVKAGRILLNPMEGLRLPKEPFGPPRDALTIEEAAKLIEAPNTSTAIGIRDRAVIELMYSTGMRRGEVVRLDLPDVNFPDRRVFIRQSKGKKDRVVPFGAAAAEWMRRYLEEARILCERDSAELAFFLTERGARFTTTTIPEAVAKYREKARIAKPVTAHTMRHTFATHMIQAGADPRHVQAILGHSSIETTEIYTHLAPADILEAHRKFHPRGG